MHLVAPSSCAPWWPFISVTSSVVEALRTTWRDRPSLSDSVGLLSCTRRLRVDGEYRVLLTASGPRFVCKDIGSCAVAARRIGNVFCDRGFADVFLRHLMQTGGRMHMAMNRLQCDIQLQGCQQGHVLPEHPKTMWPVAQDIVRSPDVSAWKSALYRRPSVSKRFHVLSVDRLPWVSAGATSTPGGSHQDHVDHNTCVLTTRTLQGAVLDLAVVPSISKPHVVVSALENAALPDGPVGVHWVVVDNASLALHAAVSWSFESLRGVALDTCHLPMKYEAVAQHHGSAGSRMLRRSARSTCPSLQRSARTWTRLNPFFEASGTGSSLVTYDHLCRASLSREHTDAAAGPWRRRDSVLRRDEKQAFQEGENQAAVVGGGWDVPEVPVVLEQCTTPLDGGVPAGGRAGHRDMR